MKNYLKSEVCRPWQNTVYTLIMHPSTERKRRDGYDRWGWALCSSQPIADEYLLQSLGTLPASSSRKPTAFRAGGRLTLSGPPLHFVGEEIAFMVISCASSIESGP